ncbi:MAG: DUF4835 family protein [Muribaculaceae bacterium]
MKKILLLLVLTLLPSVIMAEELNCTVEVNAQQVEGSNKEVFKTLQSAITEYMNTTKWSNAQFSPNEKIECKLFFTIKKYENEVMSGDLQIQSSRPVYNSSYTTTLINFKDSKIEFPYRENEPLIHSENTMENNLTAILDFYANLILAIDFDSFSRKGGEPFYEKADAIVQMAQSAGESGWKAFEDNKNRAAVLSAFTQPSTAVIRELLYNYHRGGLDEMSTSPDKGRAKITESLQALKQIYDAAPMSVALSMFRDAKLDELVNIYSKSQQAEREGVYELLYPLYPTDNDRLTKIKNGTNK